MGPFQNNGGGQHNIILVVYVSLTGIQNLRVIYYLSMKQYQDPYMAYIEKKLFHIPSSCLTFSKQRI